jgi:hypothetical protein
MAYSGASVGWLGGSLMGWGRGLRLFAKNNCRNAKVKIVQTFESLQYEASHVRALLLILIPAHSLSLS